MKPGSDATRGMLLAVAAYGLWGFAPVYWKLLRALPAGELLAHRVLGSLVVGALLIAVDAPLARARGRAAVAPAAAADRRLEPADRRSTG